MDVGKSRYLCNLVQNLDSNPVFGRGVNAETHIKSRF